MGEAQLSLWGEGVVAARSQKGKPPWAHLKHDQSGPSALSLYGPCFWSNKHQLS